MGNANEQVTCSPVSLHIDLLPEPEFTAGADLASKALKIEDGRLTEMR